MKTFRATQYETLTSVVCPSMPCRAVREPRDLVATSVARATHSWRLVSPTTVAKDVIETSATHMRNMLSKI